MDLNLEPVLQAEAGIEYPWHGIFDGVDNPPVSLWSSDSFISF
jgi:hypothetical protein